MVIRFFLVLLALEATQQWAQANNIKVTTEDEKILKSLYSKFKCQFDIEKNENQKQFAIFYYGKPQDIDKIDLNKCKLAQKGESVIFLVKPDYTLNPKKRADQGCSFTAARLKSSSDKHTEKTCLYSFGEMVKGHISYTRCPDSSGKGNVYMYSYRNPCACVKKDPDEKYCTTVISNFAKKCGGHFDNVIIGYQETYKDSEEDCQKVISSTTNVGMKKMDFPKVACPRNEL